MQRIKHPIPPPEPAPAIAEPVGLPAGAVIDRLLEQAAALSAQHGLDVDSFMKAAWTAYVEARPGLRDYLEEMQLRTQIDELRKLGRVGEA